MPIQYLQLFHFLPLWESKMLRHLFCHIELIHQLFISFGVDDITPATMEKIPIDI